MPIFPRDNHHINFLIGKRLLPNRRRKPIPHEMRQQRMDRLLLLQAALQADQLTFDIFCREHWFFSRMSKRGRKRLESMMHCRTFRDVRLCCLEHIHTELSHLMPL